MQEIITPYDFVLLPLYLFLFYLVIRKKSKKYEHVGLRKTFITAFWLRMAGAVGYGLLIQYYYGYGDSFGFYLGGNVIAHMIQQDITSVKYLFASGNEIVSAAKSMGLGDDIPVSMPTDSNTIIMKLSAVLSFFTFNKYLIISACFGFFSFIGVWKLFKVFYHLNNKKHIKLLAFFVLYFPSLWFWGSGLLKEAICVGILGIIINLLYKSFIEKKYSVSNLLFSLLLLFIMTIVKSYITIILIISLLTALIYKAVSKIKNMVFRLLIIGMLLFIMIITLITIDVSHYVNYFVNTSVNQIQNLQRSYQNVQEDGDGGSKSTFMIADINPSLQSIVTYSPIIIGTCLFRPFVWESQKVIIFFASLEALLTLLVTVYIFWKTKLFLFFKYIFSSGALLFCFTFSILFALVVGYTTFNFGTLIRYKIIFLPFYYYMLVHIYTIIKEKSNSTSSALFT